MAEFFTFADGILILDSELENAPMGDEVAQEDAQTGAEPVVVEPVSRTEADDELEIPLIRRNAAKKSAAGPSKKRPQDKEVEVEEELTEGIFIKRPRLPGCPDVRPWFLERMNPPSILNP